MDKKSVLSAAVLLVAAVVVIFGFGNGIFRGSKGDAAMEQRSYEAKTIKTIHVDTDAPSVIITPVDGDQINLSWEMDDDVEYRATLENDSLSIEYRLDSNWVRSAVLSVFGHRDYILEIELPKSFAGVLDIATASGKIIADTQAALDSCSLLTASGGISAVNLNAQADITVQSASGKIDADRLQAKDGIYIKNISGSIVLTKSKSDGDVKLVSVSGGINASEITSGGTADVKSTSGSITLSQIDCADDAVLVSNSGSLKPLDISCQVFSGKTVSGSIRFQGLTAESITCNSTSGSVHGTVEGRQKDYAVTVSTVSGSSNLQNASGGMKKLTVKTVSGSINIQFTGNTEE